MAMRKWFGALVAGGLVGMVAAGCSSSNSVSSSSDAGDAAARKMLDSGIGGIVPPGDDAGLGAGGFDGTTGQQCASDADCASDAGPGINLCSSDFGFMITNVPVQLWATPVCILPPPQSAAQGNCDPVPGGIDDGLPHFCDGPDVPTSPGLCLPFDIANPQPGQGVCYPLCTFALDGSKATGCVGTDSCFPVTFLRSSTSGAVTGYGFCNGGCQQDADCTSLGAGYVCQTDVGYCTMAKVTRTKAIGAACTTSPAAGTTVSPTDDSTSGACNCDSDPMTGQGFCSTSCIVGGLPCPGGWLCDAGYPNPLVFTSSQGGAPISVPVTAQNMGIPGICRPPCTPADAGASDGAAAPIVADGGSGGCPPNSTCQSQDVVGADCVP